MSITRVTLETNSTERRGIYRPEDRRHLDGNLGGEFGGGFGRG